MDDLVDGLHGLQDLPLHGFPGLQALLRRRKDLHLPVLGHRLPRHGLTLPLTALVARDLTHQHPRFHNRQAQHQNRNDHDLPPAD
jgi:hypothetical protein